MEAIKFDNVRVKKDGDFKLTNLSFVDFPSRPLRDQFVKAAKENPITDAGTTLKFQYGMTPTAISQNKPLYAAMSRIERNSASFQKSHIKVLWKKRTLEYKGEKAWVQNEEDDNGTWYNSFSQFNDDPMSDK